MIYIGVGRGPTRIKEQKGELNDIHISRVRMMKIRLVDP